MRSSLFVIASLASIALAAPSQSPNLANIYSLASREIELAQRSGNSGCDLCGVVVPSSTLPPPDAGQRLLHVAIGRGTQNYTCDSLSSDTKPKPIGAVARLFDASCIAAHYPYLLSLLPNIALQLSASYSDSLFGPMHSALLGHHYFRNATTPVFDLNTTPDRQFGVSAMTKADSADAPPTALKGVTGEEYGAVPWLRLKAIPGSTGDCKVMYRVNTAGGKAPATCEGQSAVFTVQYAAEYWCYG